MIDWLKDWTWRTVGSPSGDEALDSLILLPDGGFGALDYFEFLYWLRLTMLVFFLESALDDPVLWVSLMPFLTSNVTYFEPTLIGLLDLTDFEVGFFNKLGFKLEKLLLATLRFFLSNGSSPRFSLFSSSKSERGWCCYSFIYYYKCSGTCKAWLNIMVWLDAFSGDCIKSPLISWKLVLTPASGCPGNAGCCD